ncbi:MAG: type II toxin-antitoxin system PemK/MazF family toxin [Thermoanaerobaculia bacterium]|nr:MAG: type II toxin-antitoxin system PemK/MazF family toxin [Thermoanaerobaculia bacterium]MBZ0101955.1 type II toxin-antitoxin system PemK/MazF family toxin [Thermoanaerobaculia bacterium]
MKRGDVVTLALSGDFGKPRPAVVVQSDLFAEHPSVTLLPVTSELRELPLFRIPIEANETNGLARNSEVMVDKIQTVSRAKIGARIGSLPDGEMLAVTRSLALFIGIA